MNIRYPIYEGVYRILTNIREICPLHALLSINGLLLLHIYKWRAAVSRIWFMVFLHYLH